jgi:8-oxo-dGTP pyrophosphatase MutT (NUDIX family)
MNRPDILLALQNYTPFDLTDNEFKAQTLSFVTANEAFWQRTTLEGHLTGSAWVVSPDRSHTLLIHHVKLDRWLQPGGHAEDSDEGLAHTAAREAVEECGLRTITLLRPDIFDIDVHPIPAKGEWPEHLHYDIRYLFEAPMEATTHDIQEVKGLRWVPISELLDPSTPQSIRRMAEKTVL